MKIPFGAGWLLPILFLCGCGKVIDKQAAEDFMQAHPRATIYEQFIGEGDSDHAYMHFRYTEAGLPDRMEQMWLYQRQKDDSWKAVRKSGPKPPGSNFVN